MKQRKISVRIFKSIAVERIKNDQCPACAKPKKNWDRRTDWRCCSIECTIKFDKEFVICWNWQDLRERIIKRDKRTCQQCKKHQDELPKKKIKSYDGFFIEWSQSLEVDHIIPIALGGEEFDLENCQTLCENCHKNKTRKDIKKIATLRKKEKLIRKGQTFLQK